VPANVQPELRHSERLLREAKRVQLHGSCRLLGMQNQEPGNRPRFTWYIFLQIDNILADVGGITGVTIGLSVITVLETAVGVVSFTCFCLFKKSFL
jgi:hypothetical protein